MNEDIAVVKGVFEINIPLLLERTDDDNDSVEVLVGVRLDSKAVMLLIRTWPLQTGMIPPLIMTGDFFACVDELVTMVREEGDSPEDGFVDVAINFSCVK